MKYQEFIEIVKTHIKEHVSSMHKVVVQPIIKNNGTTYDGLIIMDPVLNISPTIYLNPYYHRYLNGVPLSDIFADILHTYKEHIPEKDFDISLFKDYPKAKSRILMRLVNHEKNKELLETIPYIPFCDLAIIFVCSVSDFLEEYATILIHNEHLDLWGITLTELYQSAMRNTPSLLPYQFQRMDEYLNSMLDSLPPFYTESNMYFLTNNIRIHGAVCMLYPKLLQYISEQLEDNLIILPSSIHEVIILPEKIMENGYTLTDFQDMIIEANEISLTDDEILSDHAYMYMRNSGNIIYHLE